MAEQTYTLSQAAAHLMVREDSVVAFLSEMDIDFTRRSPAVITQPEMDTLSKIVQVVKEHRQELSY